MSLVLERAQQLAKALENCDEYRSYKKALDELEKHEAARLMWSDFQKRQTEVQRARLSGEDISEDRIKDLERSYEILMMNPYVRDVIAAEFRFTHLFADIQKIIGEAVGIRYADPQEREGQEKESGATGSAGADRRAESAAATGQEGAELDQAGEAKDASTEGAGSDPKEDDDDLKGPRRIIVPGRDI